LLWKLPVGEIDGISYYAAIRVIDNNAAINVNTALSEESDFVGFGNRLQDAGQTVNINPSLFPSNIGMADRDPITSEFEMFEITQPQTANGVLGYIYANAASPNGAGSPPFPHDNIGANLAKADGPTDFNIARTDFAFMTQGDAIYHQLARRMDNPGLTSVVPGPRRFQAFPLSDTVNLAQRFCLRSSGGSVYGTLETLFNFYELYNPSGVNAIPNERWDPLLTGQTSIGAGGQTNGWFQFNFMYPGAGAGPAPIQGFNLRPLLVTHNGATNRTSALVAPSNLPVPQGLPITTKMYDVINPEMVPYDPPVAIAATSYNAGDWVKYFDAAKGTWGVYRCLSTGSTSAALVGVDAINPPSPYHENANWVQETWTPSTVRTSINTAAFSELWRSFYNVMADQWNIAANTVPAPAPGSQAVPPTPAQLQPQPARGRVGKAMFKSPIRGSLPTPLSDTQVAQLRAAIAAVNAMDLRDQDDDVTSRKVVLVDDPTNPAASQRPAVNVTVYGQEKQLFITKVYIHVDAGVTYVAVELYNPYVNSAPAQPAPPLAPTFFLNSLAAATPNNIYLGLRGATLDHTVSPATLTEFTTAATFSASTATVAPGQFVILVSQAAPVGPGAPPVATPVVVVAGLEQFVTKGKAPGAFPFLPGELVLFRTHKANGVSTTVTAAAEPDPEKQYDEANVLTGLQDNVPMDQYDLTGTNITAPMDIYYYRPVGAIGAATDNWNCVYPIPTGTAYTQTSAAVNVAAGEGQPQVYANTPIPWGAAQAEPVGTTWHTIQLNNQDWPAPRTSGGQRVYPYGGFARNGDILMCPFIGSYVITETVGGALDEVNSVTIDALEAEDSDSTALAANMTVYDDPKAADTGIESREQVGRFCPLTAAPVLQWPPFTTNAVVTGLQVNTQNMHYWEAAEPYAWTNRLFDYFTVQAPHDDYFPNAFAPDWMSAANGALGGGGTPNVPPDPVANGSFTANSGEDAIPIQGQININTADWKVLSMLPLVRRANGSVDRAATDAMAKAIVYYRDVDDFTEANNALPLKHPHGPFKSIFELNRVEDHAVGAPTPPVYGYAGFRNGYGTGAGVNIDFRNARTVDVDARQGDLSPKTLAPNEYPKFDPNPATAAAQPTDAVTGDFKEKFLALSRISNLITTRSDSFTCYLLVQGWRGAGTANATLVAQKRGAFILDRSNVGYTIDPSGKRTLNIQPTIYKVPGD
jgi:hypothetical protein